MDTDVKWDRRLYENFDMSKLVWKEVKRERRGDTGREEVVKDFNGRLFF